ASQKLNNAGYKVTSETPQGNPKELIPAAAKNGNADLIMIGTHWHNVITRFLLGGTAQSVLRSGVCSVEVVRRNPPQAGHAMKILLATDGSEFSTKAAEAVDRRPWPPDTEVKIVSAYRLVTDEVPSLAISMHSSGVNVVDEVMRIARKRA